LGLDSTHTGRIGFTIRTDSIAAVGDETPAQTAGRSRVNGTVTGSIVSFDLNANVNIDHLLYGTARSDRLNVAVKGTGLNTDGARLELHGRADSISAFGEQADTTLF